MNIVTGGNVNLTGGFVTGNSQASAAIQATGPINLTIGGSLNITGSLALPLLPAPNTPITLIFTGGGGQNFIVDPSLAPAYIQTFPTFIPITMPPEAVVATQSSNLLADLFAPLSDTGEGDGGDDQKKKPQSCN